MTTVKKGELRYTFEDNGMISGIFLPEKFGVCNLLKTPSYLKVTMKSGTELFVAPGKCRPASFISVNGAEIIDFSNLALADKDGRIIDGFRFSLRYELFDDGTAFTDAFFLGEMAEKEEICGFELFFPLKMSTFETVRWALTFRPKKTDGTLIQTSAPERELLPGQDRELENVIFPLTSFNCWNAGGLGCYFEFVMEGDNVLAGSAANNRSAVRWVDGDPVLYWNFQTAPVRPASGPWQWRNRWGWVAVSAGETRHYPPMAMYHYFDNSDRYPSDEALEQIAATGAKILIIHENWRTDVQNGGDPYDPVRFREVIEFAHSRDIRVMVYIRGNEDSIVEEMGDWFPRYLKKDYDGLYMDYGGPFHNIIPPNESYQGGRIQFRKHYFENLQRRSIVGKDGLLFSHTGPMFSALGLTGGTVDGYVSGEGERGLLVKSRLDHAYFSMAPVCPGTMWTAAFPEYSSPLMIPFLAAAGQNPHATLGVQFTSSSLAHPPVPGIGDVNFRPLWKLWQFMYGEKDIRIFNDYNCTGIFARQESLAHYWMVKNGKAVCIYTNMTGEPLTVDPAADDFAAAGIAPGSKGSLCLPDVHSPGEVKPFAGEKFTLQPYAAGAAVFGISDFSSYEQPYPELKEIGRKYMELVAEQAGFRQGSGRAEDWFIRIAVEDLPLPYESSMIVDLYDNRFELNVIKDGKAEAVGYLARDGFHKDPPEQKDFIVNGTSSCWISLRDILGSGKKDLALRSLHRGDLHYINTPFYSFMTVDFARKPGETEYTVRFMNELESDRSWLHFSVDIAD